MSIAKYRQLITKILVGTAIVLGAFVGAAAPAGADTNSTGAHPNPFSTLSCSCREMTPAGSPGRQEEINRGIQSGVSAWSPGRRAP